MYLMHKKWKDHWKYVCVEHKSNFKHVRTNILVSAAFYDIVHLARRVKRAMFSDTKVTWNNIAQPISHNCSTNKNSANHIPLYLHLLSSHTLSGHIWIVRLFYLAMFSSHTYTFIHFTYIRDWILFSFSYSAN